MRRRPSGVFIGPMLAGFYLALMVGPGFEATGRAADSTGTIAGAVLDPPHGIASANVIIPSLRIGAMTDSAGRFVIATVPPGSHIMRTVAHGYGRAVSQQVLVRAGETTLVEVMVSHAGEVLITEFAMLPEVSPEIIARLRRGTLTQFRLHRGPDPFPALANGVPAPYASRAVVRTWVRDLIASSAPNSSLRRLIEFEERPVTAPYIEAEFRNSLGKTRALFDLVAGLLFVESYGEVRGIGQYDRVTHRRLVALARRIFPDDRELETTEARLTE